MRNRSSTAAARRAHHHRLGGGGRHPRGPRRLARSPHQGRPVAGDRRRRSRRSRDPRGSRARASRCAGGVGRGSGRAPPASSRRPFMLVDPLDGTRELLAGRDEFTVNVAIVSGGRPRLGIVAAPALGLLWRGTEGRGAERLRLAPGAPAGAAHERDRDPDPALPGSGPDRRGQPLASRRRRRRRSWPGCRWPSVTLRIGDQILPGRRGRRRHLSALSPDLRMGRRRRPRGAGGGRRDRHHAGRSAADLRPDFREFPRSGLRGGGDPSALEIWLVYEAGR